MVNIMGYGNKFDVGVEGERKIVNDCFIFSFLVQGDRKFVVLFMEINNLGKEACIEGMMMKCYVKVKMFQDNLIVVFCRQMNIQVWIIKRGLD